MKPTARLSRSSCNRSRRRPACRCRFFACLKSCGQFGGEVRVSARCRIGDRRERRNIAGIVTREAPTDRLFRMRSDERMPNGVIEHMLHDRCSPQQALGLACRGATELAGIGLCRRCARCAGERTSMLDSDECDRARLARDPAYDGRFYTGVRTTRIYCRPVCPVRPAQSRNVRFYSSAAAAELAGFRPCLRCRPETAPFSPAWNGSRTTVARGLRLISRGALDAKAASVSDAGRQARGRRTASRTAVHETPRRKSEPGRQDRTRAAGKATAGYDVPADLTGRAGRRFRQPASVQRGICRSLWSAADRNASQATASVALRRFPTSLRGVGRPGSLGTESHGHAGNRALRNPRRPAPDGAAPSRRAPRRRAADRRRLVGHLAHRPAVADRSASSARWRSCAWPRTGARRSSATATRRAGCSVANAAVPGAAPTLLGHRRGQRRARHESFRPSDHRLWKTQLRDGDADPAFAARGRRAAGRASTPRPPRVRRIAARVPDRRDLLRHPPRALPAGDRPRAIRTWRRALAGAGRRRRQAHKLRPGARRRQPEEHPARARRARCSSTPSAPGGATRRSTSPSASTTCC